MFRRHVIMVKFPPWNIGFFTYFVNLLEMVRGFLNVFRDSRNPINGGLTTSNFPNGVQNFLLLCLTRNPSFHHLHM